MARSKWDHGFLNQKQVSAPCRGSTLLTTKPPGKSLHCILEKGSAAATDAAKSHQLCPTLCDPIDGSPTGSSVIGILQTRTQEWVAISFSNAWKWKIKVKSLSHVQLLATPWTVAHQDSPSMGFPRQEYWSGVCCLLLRRDLTGVKLKLTLRWEFYCHLF